MACKNLSYVLWEENPYNGSGYRIWLRIKDEYTGQWYDSEILHTNANARPAAAAPVVSGFYAFWKGPNSILWKKLPPMSPTEGSVAGTDGNSGPPAIAFPGVGWEYPPLRIAWEQSGAGIRFAKGEESFLGDWQWTVINVAENSGATVHSNPTLVVDDVGNSCIAWESRDNVALRGDIRLRYITRNGTLSGVVVIAGCASTGSGYFPSAPSLTLHRKQIPNLDHMTLAWSAPGGVVASERTNGTWGNPYLLDTEGRNPNVMFSSRLDDTARFLVSTNPSGQLHALRFRPVSPGSIVTSQLRATGWNLVSVPNTVSDYHACAVFSTATSQVFSYNGTGGYTPQSMLANGPGYVAKFPNTERSITFAGAPLNSLTFNVPAGWTLIGSISIPLHVSRVGTSPEGNIRSGIFGLRNSGYHVADSIRPGVGYWVRMRQAGTVSLPAGIGGPFFEEEVMGYDKFTITDARGREQEVYVRNSELTEFPDIDTEMPPALPEAEFDVRFEFGEVIMTVHPDSGEVDIAIAINEAEYPVTVTWEINPENGITYSDGGGGMGKAALPGGSGTKLIASRESGVVRFTASATKGSTRNELPTAYALAQNYPNPFNPSTTFKFDLPEPATFSLVVYDLLGRQIAEVVSGRLEAGYHSRTWSATGLRSSGVYFARFTAIDAAGVVKHAAVSKLVLMK